MPTYAQTVLVLSSMLVDIKDTVSILKSLTLSRLWNMLIVFLSYIVSRVLRQPIHWGMPISLSIEPTTSCNLRCPECPSGLRSFTRPTGMLEGELFEKLLSEVSAKTLYMLFYFQGEPYLHPDFLLHVNKASAKRIYTATSTNAHYLNDENARKTVESGLKRLIISIDGASQETYESYRVGGNLNKVIEGTKNVIKWKNKLKSSSPSVVFQFLVVKPNEHEIDEIKQLGKELGVDKVLFKSAQIYDYENGSPLIPSNSRYSRYTLDSNTGKYVIKSKLFNHCWKMWHSCVLTWDGKVVPCCFDKDADHVLGDFQTDSFEGIWKSNGYVNFRKSIIKGRDQIDICTNCTEGTKVWV